MAKKDSNFISARESRRISKSNAKITKKTVFEDEDDYVGRDVYEFSSSVPGEYVVHVKPKKASAYASDIDDIYINVV